MPCHNCRESVPADYANVYVPNRMAAPRVCLACRPAEKNRDGEATRTDEDA